MIVSDSVIFLELQKTATTYIGTVLSALHAGEQVGRHNRLTPDLIDSGRKVLGSIRNPWDWYVSLWAFGCGGRGSLYRRLTSRTEIRRAGWRNHPMGTIRYALRRLGRSPSEWKRCYTHVQDVDAFRTWLRRIHHPDHWADLGEGYCESGVQGMAGILTYRYMELFTRAPGMEKPYRFDSYDALKNHVDRHTVVDYWIRTENVDDDLLRVLPTCGIGNEQSIREVLSVTAPVNRSALRESRLLYYDRELADLVGRRDRLVVESFGYEPPAVPD